METQLSIREKELLIKVLQKEENNLIIGINHCKHHEFKEALKEELQEVKVLLKKMKMNEPSHAF
jgi:hypothetical protein